MLDLMDLVTDFAGFVDDDVENILRDTEVHPYGEGHFGSIRSRSAFSADVSPSFNTSDHDLFLEFIRPLCLELLGEITKFKSVASEALLPLGGTEERSSIVLHTKVPLRLSLSNKTVM